MDLMEQQEIRRKQLFDTLIDIEQQNKSQQEDFWLLQYQKLIDSRPTDLSISANSIDPALGYNFLVNGVVHCLPFLSKIWQSKAKDLSSITDEDLLSAGISKATDRSNILLSIQQFLDNDGPAAASAPIKHSESVSDSDDQRPTTTKDETGEFLAECVICMEYSVSLSVRSVNRIKSMRRKAVQRILQTILKITFDVLRSQLFNKIYLFQCKIIFIPCGHMCCCQNCHSDLQLCPMCRSDIDRRIKVIQP